MLPQPLPAISALLPSSQAQGGTAVAARSSPGWRAQSLGWMWPGLQHLELKGKSKEVRGHFSFRESKQKAKISIATSTEAGPPCQEMPSPVLLL